MITPTIDSYVIPSQDTTKLDLQIYKKIAKISNFGIWQKNLYVTHFLKLLRCINMKRIQWVLWKIQSGHESIHRWTDRRTDKRTRWNYTTLFQLRWSGGITIHNSFTPYLKALCTMTALSYKCTKQMHLFCINQHKTIFILTMKCQKYKSYKNFQQIICKMDTFEASVYVYINGWVQDCNNSIANALELLQSCNKPSICWTKELYSLQEPTTNNYPSSMLTHWGRDKMAAVSQTTLSNAFSWMKML